MTRKVTCYFVVQLADGSISSTPKKRVLVVEGNHVTVSFNGLMCMFFVPNTGSRFLYEVDSPQPLTVTHSSLTSQQLKVILDKQIIRSLVQSLDSPSLFQRIFGRKAALIPLSSRIVLEEAERGGVVEGDFIIFSRKMWEELKTR